MNKKVRVEVSARHVHLTKEDFEKLFGEGAELTIMKELSQPGMFAANETVSIKDEYFQLDRIRIVGPIRNYTQVEISETEARNFKINPPLRKSGDIEGTPGITIIGPKGKIDIKEGVIVAQRHLHMAPKDAKKIGAKDGDPLNVKIEGNRGLVFGNVVARVDKTYAWACHIDTDEGNAASLTGCKDGTVILDLEKDKTATNKNSLINKIIKYIIILLLFLFGILLGIVLENREWQNKAGNDYMQIDQASDSQQINDGMMRAWKPNIYLYPTEEQETTVKLNYDGKLIASYPDYNYSINGWKVTAYPDGRIINEADNKEYSYLFWEGESYNKIKFDMSEGFVVEGKDVKIFLQKTLAEMGLTPKEYNEFIVYWYPKMKDNKYNFIHFAGKEYTDSAVLNIIPKPDSMLRIFMEFKSIDKKIEVPPQTIIPFERKGFAVVEWGGTEIED